MRRLLLMLGFGLAACTAPEITGQKIAVPVPEETAPAEAVTAWRFDQHAADLRAASCPGGTAFERAQTLAIIATPVDRGTAGQQDQALNGMSFAGAWHLTADEPNFGGLSGLTVLR